MFHVEHTHPIPEFHDLMRAGAEELGVPVSEEALRQFDVYFEELCRWDHSINLTGLRTVKERAVLLFLDSIAARFAFMKIPTVQTFADIGSGGGFPGIPIKLIFPHLTCMLFEPKGHKTAFLRFVIGRLGLTGISVIQKRLEGSLSSMSEDDKCEVALCKGIKIEPLLPLLPNIIKKNGKLIVFRSKNIDNLEPYKQMQIVEEISYELPFGFGHRVLSLLEFSRPTI